LRYRPSKPDIDASKIPPPPKCNEQHNYAIRTSAEVLVDGTGMNSLECNVIEGTTQIFLDKNLEKNIFLEKNCASPSPSLSHSLSKDPLPPVGELHAADEVKDPKTQRVSMAQVAQWFEVIFWPAYPLKKSKADECHAMSRVTRLMSRGGHAMSRRVTP